MSHKAYKQLIEANQNTIHSGNNQRHKPFSEKKNIFYVPFGKLGFFSVYFPQILQIICNTFSKTRASGPKLCIVRLYLETPSKENFQNVRFRYHFLFLANLGHNVSLKYYPLFFSFLKEFTKALPDKFWFSKKTQFWPF